MKKFIVILQLTLAIAFWLRLELSQLPYLFLIPYFLTGMFATLFVSARKAGLPFKTRVATGAIAGYVLSLGFHPVFPQAFITGFTSLGWLFGILLFGVYFFEGGRDEPAFQRFARHFGVRFGGGAGEPLDVLRAAFGGQTFGNGLYRIYTVGEAATATRRIGEAHPDAKDKVDVFAIDWLRREYAVGEGRVVMFSPITGEVLDAPVGLVAFHDRSLVDNAGAILDAPLFKAFLRARGVKGLARDEQVALKVPLSEGGKIEVDNFEIRRAG